MVNEKCEIKNACTPATTVPTNEGTGLSRFLVIVALAVLVAWTRLFVTFVLSVKSDITSVVNHYVCALYFVLSQFTLSIVECHPSVISAESLSCI